MSEHEIALLAKMVEGASETVWQIALLAVYGNALANLVWAIFTFVGFTGCALASVRCLQIENGLPPDKSFHDKRFAWNVWAVLFGIATALVFIACAANIAAFMARMIAPEAYAIRWLILQAQ